MSGNLEKLSEFVNYAKSCKGYEKGEAQVFCDRLFQAFGHRGYKEAGAELEYPLKTSERRIIFPDLIWKPFLLLEMKSRDENLAKHYEQVKDYWLELFPNRPRYVVSCNFIELWIYDFEKQLREPVDKFKVEDLPKRYTALNFLFPKNPIPIFCNNRVDVTKKAARALARIYNSIISRGNDIKNSQKFILQCLMALFSEDIGLLPNSIFTEIIIEAEEKNNSYDLFSSLFTQMNLENRAPESSRYRNVPYFNGGLFSELLPIELTIEELKLLREASKEDWSKIEPVIFGEIYEAIMGDSEKSISSSHFTYEKDIQKIIYPTIIKPWKLKIKKAKTLKELLSIRDKLLNIKILDPACGSGNFLYVAFRELKKLERLLINSIQEKFKGKKGTAVGTMSLIKTSQFFGIDTNPFAIELAKITLMIGKKLALDEINNFDMNLQLNLDIEIENSLPLDNLDQNFFCGDALLDIQEWEKVDYIIGNPPFQAKNKMVKKFGRDYVDKLRGNFPEIPGRADYCVYWFRKSHDNLIQGGGAGLVGTNTIRQNYSREGGLDYIVDNGGTIVEAVSTQVWPGEAVVNVSIVNWIKGKYEGPKRLSFQKGNSLESPWEVFEVETINSQLSNNVDLSKVKAIKGNKDSFCCHQGQTHGHAGFLLNPEMATRLISENNLLKEVIHPYLIAGKPFKEEDFLGHPLGQPSRYIIDLNFCKDLVSAMKYKEVFQILQETVLPAMQEKALEQEQNQNNEKDRIKHLETWWKYWRPREQMIKKIKEKERYIICSRVTKRPIFDFVSSTIRPNDSLSVFSLDDEYSLGILQSKIHYEWFFARCSSMKMDPRYTPNSVFNSFPFPQNPSKSGMKKIAYATANLCKIRNELKIRKNIGLRALYKELEIPGKHPLKDAHEELDKLVMEIYDFNPKRNILESTYNLNKELIYLESQNLEITSPGQYTFNL